MISVSTRNTLNQTIRIQYDFTHRSNLYEGVLSSARQASPDWDLSNPITHPNVCPIFAKNISSVKELCVNLWLEYNNLLKYTHMKGLLKNLGLLLILVGVIILIACSLTGEVNNNAVLGGSIVLVVLGLITYIAINKRIAD